MFKIIACLLAGFSLLVASPSWAAKKNDDRTTSPVVPGILTITPTMQDLSSTSIVIEKTIYGYDPIFTTVTLELAQDEKAKIVGTAKFESNRPATGKPAVTLPLEFNVTGKIKDGSFSLKGKKKFEEGEGKTYISRIISLSIKANMLEFVPATLSAASDILSTATYQMNVKVSGLGTSYSYLQNVDHRAEYHFIYQKLSDEEALGLKQPKGGWLYKVSTPYGYPLVNGVHTTGTVTNEGVDYENSTILRLKGKNFNYLGEQYEGNNIPPFMPNRITLKTKYGTEKKLDPFRYGTALATFEIYDGGTN